MCEERDVLLLNFFLQNKKKKKKKKRQKRDRNATKKMRLSFFLLVLLALLQLLQPCSSLRTKDVSDCQVLIAGGSTSSLAAAWAAANANTSVTVCLLEIADWVGGQLTASAVSAIDYGSANDINRHPKTLTLPFRMLSEVFNDSTGGCWVSERCFQPLDMMEQFIWPHTQFHESKNLRVYLNTTVIASSRDGASGNIVSLTAVQRTPVAPYEGYDQPLSDTLADWYSPSDSALFTKTVLKFTNFAAVIDATEFGDLLMTSGVAVSQGMETPNEDSLELLDTCGQGNTVDFYMTYNKQKKLLLQQQQQQQQQQREVKKEKGEEKEGEEDVTAAEAAAAAWEPPLGCTPCNTTVERDCCHYSTEKFSWTRIWTYRRSKATSSRSFDVMNDGDVSLQNWDAQDSNVYVFLPLDAARAQVQQGAWAGGVNISALRYSEQRSYGWYWWFKNNNTEEGDGLVGLCMICFLFHALSSCPLSLSLSHHTHTLSICLSICLSLYLSLSLSLSLSLLSVFFFFFSFFFFWHANILVCNRSLSRTHTKSLTEHAAVRGWHDIGSCQNAVYS